MIDEQISNYIQFNSKRFDREKIKSRNPSGSPPHQILVNRVSSGDQGGVEEPLTRGAAAPEPSPELPPLRAAEEEDSPPPAAEAAAGVEDEAACGGRLRFFFS